MRGEIHVRVVDLRGTALEKLERPARVGVGQQEIERTAENLGLRIAEDPLAGGIEGLDVPGVIDRDDGVLDVVEDRLQVRGALLADLPGERLRLVGHELHGAHDAAPLGVDAVVMCAHDLEQRGQIDLAATPARVVQLTFEQVIQVPLRWRRLAPNGGRGIA